MSLNEYLERRITEEKERIEREEQARLEQIKAEYEQQCAELERTYEYEVEQAIETQVNRERFVRRRDERFNSLSHTRNELDKAFVSFVPELLESEWFANYLNRFVKDLPHTGSLRVSGRYASALAQKLSPYVSSPPQRDNDDHIGRIIFETDEKRWELNMQSLLNELKTQTLPLLKEDVTQ
jgi:vacuolar-type H+-ATPase subunit E/Vma4